MFLPSLTAKVTPRSDILRPVPSFSSLCGQPRLSPHVEASPSFATYAANDIMFRPMSSTSEDCERLECEQVHHTVRRPSLLRRFFPSLSKPQIPATPLVYPVCPLWRSYGLTLHDSITPYLHQSRFKSIRRKCPPWGIASFSTLGISRPQ